MKELTLSFRNEDCQLTSCCPRGPARITPGSDPHGEVLGFGGRRLMVLACKRWELGLKPCIKLAPCKFCTFSKGELNMPMTWRVLKCKGSLSLSGNVDRKTVSSEKRKLSMAWDCRTIFASYMVQKSSGEDANVNLVLDWGCPWSSRQKQIQNHSLGKLS